MTAKLTRAVEQVLGGRVGGVRRLAHGEVNEVYRVETTGGVFVAKVFQFATWPEADKLPWVERRLTEFGVPHAPTRYYARADTYFPHGLMISEHLAGVNALDALRAGRLSLNEYATKTAALLRQVHRIPVARFGYLAGGAGLYESFVEFKLIHEVRERIEALPPDLLPAGLYERVAALAATQLAPRAARLRPVLVHDDPQPKNVIWTEAGGPVLVDWDEAVAGAWLSDYARLTYWLEHTTTDYSAQQRADFRAAFFAGYGAVEFDADEIAAMEHVLHLIHSVDLLAFHQGRGDRAACARLRARVLRLLG
jgi:Ser/Thr protein kinase RdoA (MazF antagonist)